jgi:hypothetical protein
MQQFPPNTALSIYYTAIAQKYNLKGIYYLDLWPFGPSQMILVSPDSADLVAKVTDYPLHEMGINYLSGLVGENSMGATNGEKWKVTHRLLAPAFRASRRLWRVLLRIRPSSYSHRFLSGAPRNRVYFRWRQSLQSYY